MCGRMFNYLKYINNKMSFIPLLIESTAIATILEYISASFDGDTLHKTPPESPQTH